MQRDIRPDWLIRLAEELGGVGAGQGQPRNTNLRRSVSTAYYALFHSLALAASRAALPNASPTEIYGVVRHVGHGSIKDVAKYLAGDNPPRHLDPVVLRLRANSDLSTVASTFVELQESREDADYNHVANFTRPGTLALVARSKRAIEVVDRFASTDDFQAFFGLIALRTSIGRR